MTAIATQNAASVTELRRLTASGVLGFYTHFEQTIIFAYRENETPSTTTNVFSILVAEEHVIAAGARPKCLGERIRLKPLKDWVFGVQRSLHPIADLPRLFEDYFRTSEWQPTGKTLKVGPLIAVPPQFIPPDSTTTIPLNNVLKNNFWSGSHLIEWADPTKSDLQLFFDHPPLLQGLSDAVQKLVPIRIASLSDRLGNIVVQLPVTTMLARFGKERLTGNAVATIQWHPKATPRSLRATCELQFDKMISGYASSNIGAGSHLLPTSSADGMMRSVVWDDANRAVLAATGPTSFIETVGFSLNALQPEPRVFLRAQPDGAQKQVRVSVQHLSQNIVGTPRSAIDGGWTRRRIYKHEAAQLAAERMFVRYKPASGQQAAEHEKALRDLRLLMSLHGQKGVWLWDPFLSAADILDTLFHCPYAGAELRALTAAKPIPSEGEKATAPPRRFSIVGGIGALWQRLFKAPAPLPSFADTQRAVFDSAQSNLYGLRLEYRAKIGQAGWSFHDRFLIFPYVENGALVWSLGTSINSLGKQHHILQRVDDGQLVADAFEELWNALDQSEHMIWKKP